MSGHRHTFLHSSWRTGSTYLWDLFRRDGAALCYYEPFHEDLATLSPQRARARWPVPSEGHPVLERPYFYEYGPLAGVNGVRGYESRFAYADFFGAASSRLLSQESYLRGLMDVAERSGRAAVFGFCRSTGRLAGLRTSFPDACHILLVREAEDQWSSSASMRALHANPYFLVMPVLVLCTAAPGTRAQAVRDLLGLPEIVPSGVERDYRKALDVVEGSPSGRLYGWFCAYYLLSAVSSLPYADAVLSLSSLSRGRLRQWRTAGQLRRCSGFKVSFSSVALPVHDGALGGDLLAAGREVGAALVTLDGERPGAGGVEQAVYSRLARALQATGRVALGDLRSARRGAAPEP